MNHSRKHHKIQNTLKTTTPNQNPIQTPKIKFDKNSTHQLQEAIFHRKNSEDRNSLPLHLSQCPSVTGTSSTELVNLVPPVFITYFRCVRLENESWSLEMCIIRVFGRRSEHLITPFRIFPAKGGS